MGLRAFVLMMLFALAAPPDCASETILLGADGRVLAYPDSFSRDDGLQVEIQEEGAADATRYEVRYRYLSRVDQPIVLGFADTSAARRGQRFTIPAGDGAFLVYNLWKRPDPWVPDALRDSLKTELDKAERAIAQIRDSDAYQKLDKKRDALKTEKEGLSQSRKDEQTAIVGKIKRLREQIASTDLDVKAYAPFDVDPAVEQVRLLLDRKAAVKTRVEELVVQEDKLENPSPDEKRLDAEMAQLALEEARKWPKLVGLLEKHADIEKKVVDSEQVDFEVLRVGGVVLGDRRKVVYYRLADHADSTSVLRLMGDYPVLTQDDHIYATIVNRQNRHPGFALKVEREGGTAININPVRPTFASGIGVHSLSLPRFSVEDPYRDYVLPFGKRFKANDVLKVTIFGTLRVVITDKSTRVRKTGKETGNTTKVEHTSERKSVKLVNAVVYPQIRGLYRYNVAFGAVLTGVRNPTFAKVRTAVDDTTTSADESRYRIDRDDGGNRVLPVLGFTFYPKRVDIAREPTLIERLIPNPTLAFAVTNPANDIFIGATHELFRQTQLFWGIHYGKVSEIKPRNDVSEEEGAAVPLLRDGWEHGWFGGLSFNLDVIPKLFKMSP